MPRSLRFLVFAVLVSLSSVSHAQGVPVSPAVELANLREDVRLLTQRLGELSIRVEQLEAENARLVSTAAGAQQNVATLTQLNTAISDLSRDIKAASAQTKSEVLAVVAVQMENLAKQTNTALDAVSRNRAPSPASFADNFPKEGVSYTVQPGDTLSRIAQKTGARVADIINANKISDPSRVQVGQVLFVPGGK